MTENLLGPPACKCNMDIGPHDCGDIDWEDLDSRARPILPKSRWTQEEIAEARRRVDESTLKIEPAESAAFDHLKRTGGW